MGKSTTFLKGWGLYVMMMPNLPQSNVRKMKNKSHKILSLWLKVIFFVFDLKLNVYCGGQKRFL